MAEIDSLTERLRAGTAGVKLSPEAKQRHLDAIEAELADLIKPVDTEGLVEPASTEESIKPVYAGEPAVVGGSGEHTAEKRHRYRPVLVGSLAATFLLAWLMAASANSLPGDPLYPAKRVGERIVMVVARDQVAEHRLGELEALIEQGAPPATVVAAQRDAREALARRAVPALTERYGALVLGTPTTDGEIDPAYHHRVSWSRSGTGRTFHTSLPTGDLVVVWAEGRRPPTIEASGDWIVTEVDTGGWLIEPVEGMVTGPAAATSFRVVVSDDAIDLSAETAGPGPAPEQALARPADADDSSGGPGGSEPSPRTESGAPVATIDELQDTRSEPGSAVPAATSPPTVRPAAPATPAPRAKPPTTVKPTTTITVKPTTTTVKPTTTTVKPTTTTTRPTTTTTLPTTTVPPCRGDDDDDCDDDD